MKVDLFMTKNGMDVRAAQGGVYQVELLMDNKDPLCLYIGESVWIASRCGQHLYSVFQEPEYFGLKKEDLENNNFTLKFSVVNSVEGKKSELGVYSYKAEEMNAIRENNPLTQLNSSDRQIRDNQAKIQKVQQKMIEKGYKSS